MPQTPHLERHFTASETVRDVVFGMSDGLTVPFALAAGLSGVVDSTAIIVTAGLAEIAAGAIAMGLGGDLAARSDADHYATERERERCEVAERPEVELAEVAAVFRSYGLAEEQIGPIVQALCTRPGPWVDFMMSFELGLERPDPKRAFASARTIAVAYVVGGLIPSSPYILMTSAPTALQVSVVRYPGNPADLRLRQGPVHRCEPAAQRAPDCGRRRARSGCSIHHRASNLVSWHLQPDAFTPAPVTPTRRRASRAALCPIRTAEPGEHLVVQTRLHTDQPWE